MKRVLLLLPNGFEVLEAAAFLDVLGWADAYGCERIEVVTGALHSEVRSTFHLEVIPAMHLKDVSIEAFDAAAVPGGFERAGYYDDAYTEEFLDTIRRFKAAGKPIASICVGALPLAKSGILAGVRATTYPMGGGKRKRQLAEMGAEVADEEIVRDNNVITSTSPATAVDVAFALLEILTSRENADKIRELMGFRASPPASDVKRTRRAGR
jgi:4-methyl-5(b-hydroxyethyl)-thiazole monophosphate biosynthesis